MAMSALLTLAGMLDYRPDVLDNLQLPQAPSYADMGVEATQIRQLWTINANDFKEFLCFHTMSMCLAIPDADFLKAAVGTWSKAHVEEWQRMFETLFYKYNPLWNKDATRTETEQEARTKNGSENTTTATMGNNTVTGFTHGYNDGVTHSDDNLAWEHADKTKGSNSISNTGTKQESVTDNGSINRTIAEKGNIGVTMVQNMVTKQRELALYNIEDFIADEFKKNFCLMLW